MTRNAQDLGVYHNDNLISGDMPLDTVEILIPEDNIIKRGFVLGKITRSVPTTGTADGANTGDGTIATVLGRKYTKPGAYVLTCDAVATGAGRFNVVDPSGKSIGKALVNYFVGTGNGVISAIRAQKKYNDAGYYRIKVYEAVTNGGKFKVYDPDDKLIGQFEIPAGAGGAYAFVSDEINFTVTEGATDFLLNDEYFVAPFEHDQIALIANAGAADFIVADFFTITVAVGTNECILVDSTKSDGSEDPYCIATEDIDASITGKASDVASVGYRTGQFNARALIFGGSDTIETHKVALRDIGIFANPSVPIGDEYYRD